MSTRRRPLEAPQQPIVVAPADAPLGPPEAQMIVPSWQDAAERWRQGYEAERGRAERAEARLGEARDLLRGLLYQEVGSMAGAAAATRARAFLALREEQP